MDNVVKFPPNEDSGIIAAAIAGFLAGAACVLGLLKAFNKE